MFSEKPKREQPRKRRGIRRRVWGWMLVVVLVALVATPLILSEANRPNGLNTVDMILLTIILCAAVSLVYQIALRILGPRYERRPVEAYEMVEDDLWDERE